MNIIITNIITIIIIIIFLQCKLHYKQNISRSVMLMQMEIPQQSETVSYFIEHRIQSLVFHFSFSFRLFRFVGFQVSINK